MKTISVVVAFWKRPELTRLMFHHTAAVARECTGFNVKLIAIGSEGDASRSIAEEEGWVYVEAENSPLSAKWNAGVWEACRLGTDAVFITGSDDFFTAPILRSAAKAIFVDEADAFGYADHFFLGGGPRALWWPGYGSETGRVGEPMGSGRAFSRRVLEMLRWKLWPDDLDRGLDGACWARLRSATLFFDIKAATIPIAASGGMLVDVKRDGEEQLSPFQRYIDTGSTEIPWRSVTKFFDEATVAAWDLDPLPAYRQRAAMVTPNPVGPGPLVGLVMIAKNAEATIERAIRCVLPVIEEIIVLVDGSTTDRTVEIAREFGAVVIKEWGGFAAARNVAHGMSRARWHLVADSDETIDLGDLTEKIYEAEMKGADAVLVTVLGFSSPGRYVPQLQPRVLRAGRTKWVFKRHNDLVGIKSHVVSTAIIRNSYVGTLKEKSEAAIVDLLEMYENPQEPGVEPDDERMHAAYFLSRSYAALANWQEVRVWSERCRFLDVDGKRSTVIANAVWATLFLDGNEAALAEVNAALERHPNMAELRYVAMTIHGARYFMAAVSANQYATQPQGSLAWAHNFPQAAALLGFPVRVGEE